MGSLKSCVYGLGMLVLGYSSPVGKRVAGLVKAVVPKNLIGRAVLTGGVLFGGGGFIYQTLDKINDTTLFASVNSEGSFNSEGGFLGEFDYFRKGVLQGELVNYHAAFGLMNPFYEEANKRQSFLFQRIKNLDSNGWGGDVVVKERSRLMDKILEQDSLLSPEKFQVFVNRNLVYSWSKSKGNALISEDEAYNPNENLLSFNNFAMKPSLDHLGFRFGKKSVLTRNVSGFSFLYHTLGCDRGNQNFKIEAFFRNPSTGMLKEVVREDSIRVRDNCQEYSEWENSPSGKLTSKTLMVLRKKGIPCRDVSPGVLPKPPKNLPRLVLKNNSKFI
jgi:hypothetical protein